MNNTEKKINSEKEEILKEKKPFGGNLLEGTLSLSFDVIKRLIDNFIQFPSEERREYLVELLKGFKNEDRSKILEYLVKRIEKNPFNHNFYRLEKEIINLIFQLPKEEAIFVSNVLYSDIFGIPGAFSSLMSKSLIKEDNTLFMTSLEGLKKGADLDRAFEYIMNSRAEKEFHRYGYFLTASSLNYIKRIIDEIKMSSLPVNSLIKLEDIFTKLSKNLTNLIKKTSSEKERIFYMDLLTAIAVDGQKSGFKALRELEPSRITQIVLNDFPFNVKRDSRLIAIDYLEDYMLVEVFKELIKEVSKNNSREDEILARKIAKRIAEKNIKLLPFKLVKPELSVMVGWLKLKLLVLKAVYKHLKHSHKKKDRIWNNIQENQERLIANKVLKQALKEVKKEMKKEAINKTI